MMYQLLAVIALHDHVWARDHADELWDVLYASRYHRPAYAVQMTKGDA